jgi:hypothetical protein
MTGKAILERKRMINLVSPKNFTPERKKKTSKIEIEDNGTYKPLTLPIISVLTPPVRGFPYLNPGIDISDVNYDGKNSISPLLVVINSLNEKRNSKVSSLSRPKSSVQPTVDASIPKASVQPTVDADRYKASVQPTVDASRPKASVQPTVDASRPKSSVQPTIDADNQASLANKDQSGIIYPIGIDQGLLSTAASAVPGIILF